MTDPQIELEALRKAAGRFAALLGNARSGVDRAVYRSQLRKIEKRAEQVLRSAYKRSA